MAEHANQTTTGLTDVAKSRLKAATTLTVTLVALANAALGLAGHNPLPFTSEEVATAIFSAIGIVGTVVGWWKNQNWSTASVEAQKVLTGLKENPTEGLTAAKSAIVSAHAAVTQASETTTDSEARG